MPKYLNSNNFDEQQLEQSLPDQWQSIQNRLETVETWIIKLQKRLLKIQRNSDKQNDQMVLFRKQTKSKLEDALANQRQNFQIKQNELDLQNIRAEIQELQNHLKRSDKKNIQIFKELKNVNISPLHFSDNKLQEKIQKSLQNFRFEMDNTLKQFKKSILKNEHHIKYPKYEQASDQSKIFQVESPVKSKSKSIKKSFTHIQEKRQSSDRQNLKISRKTQQIGGNSRVSYLREKLKQFEQINKKYEQFGDKKVLQKSSQKHVVNKMKDIKTFLQQSESQIDQSNIQNDNVISHSLKKYKSGERFRTYH